MTTSQLDNNMSVFSNGAADANSIASNSKNNATQNLNSNYSNTKHNNIGSNIANNQCVNETGKRKKLKSRNILIPNTGYIKDHLDDWLETCLKDATSAQLSSSSEFLDYNPTATSNATALNTKKTNKSSSQHQLHQQQQQQHHNATQQSYLPSSHNSNQQHFPHAHPHSLPHSSQQFASRTNPHYTLAGNGHMAPFGQGFQRGFTNFPRYTQSHLNNNRTAMMFPANNSFYQQNDNSQDFASLPPIVNIMGGNSELENHSVDVLDESANNQNLGHGFRFSDPCLLNPSDNDSKLSDQNTPDQRNHVTNGTDNNKMFAALMEQINILHETNSKICRNLHETKVDIEALKHAPSWGLRQRRDSLSGLSTHSQPMIFGGGYGTHSPAPTYHSGAYTPGIMTDVVREVKEAARVREDAVLNRVKAMVEERNWSMNESNLRLMRDIEELKSQVQLLRADRKETNKKINRLEAENKYMRQMIANIVDNCNVPDLVYEDGGVRTRKMIPQTRRSQSLNLHYGTLHHQPASITHAVLEKDETLHIVEPPPPKQSNDTVRINSQRSPDDRHSFSSSDGGGRRDSNVDQHTMTYNINNDGIVGPLMSPPSFTLVSSPIDDYKRPTEINPKTHEINLESDESKHSTQELREELNEAVAARKEANDRIIALEKLVRNLQVKAIHPKDEHFSNGDSNKSIGGGLCNTDAINSASKLAPTTFRMHHHQHHTPHSAFTITQSNVHLQGHAVSNANATNSSSPKLSVAGPITDL